MPQEPAISMADVVFRFYEKGKRNILDHVSMEIAAGRLTVIMGSSGCGKSTLAAVCAGLYPENGGFLISGDIRLFGKPLKEMNPQDRSAYLSLMFQNPDLQFCMETPRKELCFCMENRCIPAEEMEMRALTAAEKAGITELLDRPLHLLSGGEKQKVSLACLSVLESKCLILDEAFANIDEDTARSLILQLKQMKAAGRSIVAIDHRLDLWLDAADEVIVIGEGGKILKRGITKENLNEAYALFEQEGLCFPGRPIAAPEKNKGAASRAAVTFSDVTIPAEMIKKRFGKAYFGHLLLENADTVFPEGRMTAILGPSGCGKTTTLLSMLKKHPYRGRINILDQDLADIPAKDLYRTMGIVFQNPANQFVSQNVEEEVLTSIRTWESGISEEICKKKAEEMLEAYGLRRFRKYSPYMLSQGQQRRLAVLSVLAGGQKILLLDEPTYGQDDKSTNAMMHQLKEKVDKEGLTVIFITHDRQLAAAWADQVMLLKDRKLETAGQEVAAK